MSIQFSEMLLIDGYNLLYCAGIAGRGFAAGTLARSRLGVLRFLVETLDPSELAQTTLVFDARDAPPGLPREFEYHGVTVRFAPRRSSADELIADLIEACAVPRHLTVVSSDHQVQRAARRRRARAVDSDVWHDEVLERQKQRRTAAPSPPPKPVVPLLPNEVTQWLEQFGGEEAVEQVLREESAAQRPAPAPSDQASAKREKRSRAKRRPQEPIDDKGPLPSGDCFPPGYADGIEDDF